MRRTNNQFAPHQQRARNAGQRHEQQNTNKNPIAGIANRARALRGAGRPRKLANANHGEPDNGLGCACENPRSRRVDRCADADQISGVRPLVALQYERHGAAGDQPEGREHDGDVEEAPGVTLLDISGAAQVFAELREIELTSASYSLSYLSTSGGLVPTVLAWTGALDGKRAA